MPYISFEDYIEERGLRYASEDEQHLAYIRWWHTYEDLDGND